MAALPVLYSFRRCPYAMRARMAVAVSGAEVELREVVLRDKPPEMLEASPKGTVPVLLLPDGNVLEESLDIMRWALGRNDPENWLAHVDADLIAANDGPFKQALDRYKYPHRYDSARWVGASRCGAGAFIRVGQAANHRTVSWRNPAWLYRYRAVPVHPPVRRNRSSVVRCPTPAALRRMAKQLGCNLNCLRVS